MKRIFPVFLSLVLVFSLICVPARASDSYIFEFPESSEDGVAFGPVLPDGLYHVKFSLSGGVLSEPFILSSDSPVLLSFEPVEDESSDEPAYFCETPLSLTSDLTESSGNFTLLVGLVGSSALLSIYDNSVSVSPVLLGASHGFVTFIPVSSFGSPAPSLSGIVDSNMMSGVLDQVVDLLPIVVGLIVGFIGLRKAISWLQGILHSA